MTVNRLSVELLQAGVRIEELAAELGIKPNTAYVMLKHPDKITLARAKKIARFVGWGPEKAMSIFFAF